MYIYINILVIYYVFIYSQNQVYRKGKAFYRKAMYTHLRYLGYQVKVGVSGNKEIDFVAERENERIYIQASYLLHSDATIEREFGNLLNIKDNYPKFVVSMDQFPGANSYKGIQHLHLRDFLSETNL